MAVKTPKKISVKVPPGFILVDKKWRETEICIELKRKFNRVVIEELGMIDFYLPQERQVLYISEAQLVGGISMEKLNGLSKNAIIIADRNTVTVEQYSKLQDQLAVELSFVLLPIGNILELPEFLYQISVVESMSSPDNQFRRKAFGINTNQQLNLLLDVPGLGKLKAEKLLNTLGTMHKIALSSVAELSVVIGAAAASKVHKYFNDMS